MPTNDIILRNRVAELGAPFGRERSCKLVAGRAFGNRFLLSVHRTALEPDPVGKIVDLLGPIGVPEGLGQALERDLPGADVVHFGYEAQGDAEICKVYFEHVSDMRRAVREPRNFERSTLVHRAWKWPLPPKRGFAVTDYVWRANRPAERTTGRIAELCAPLGADHVSARAVRAIEELAAGGVRFDDLMLLEVREEGSPRHSFDLNLYPVELTLRAIWPVIEQIGGDLDLRSDELASVLGPALDLQLGHISGGSGRDGEPFVTIYFGIEPC